MTELFSQIKQNISLHIRNIYKEGELDEVLTAKEYLIVKKEGKGSVSRKLQYYNLDIIISLGYRVKSERGTQFRIWVNKILKEYLLQGFAINDKLLQERTQQLQELKSVVQLQEKVISDYPLNTDESAGLIKS